MTMSAVLTRTEAHRDGWSQPLLGRERQQQSLDELADRVRDGLSGCLVLTGEAGIGKTRLLRYLADAAADLQVATVAGLESETELGFAALHRLLLPFLDRIERLPAPQRDALGSAFGLVRGMPADRFLIGLAVLTLLAEAASAAPLVCLIDDAHWLDRESLEVLAFVAHRLHAEGIGVVLAVRATAAGTACLRKLPTLLVDGLPEKKARQLLAATVSGRLDPGVVARVVAEADGNPLALVELSSGLSGRQLSGGSLLPEPLPVGPRMEAHFLRQIRTMPAQTQAFLLVASVAPVDDPAVLWQAADLLGLPPGAADVAVSDGILSLEGSVAFRHPLIRSAVYGGAPARQRREAHRALASVIDRQADPDRRAWHLAEATVGIDEGVAMELERASERARSRGGYTAQAGFLSRAAVFTPDPAHRAGRQFASARAHLMAGDPVAAQTLLDQAVPGLRTPTMRAEAQRLRASIEVYFARLSAVPPILLDAAETIEGLDERLIRQMVFEALGIALLARLSTPGRTPEDVARAALRAPKATGEPAVSDLLLEALAIRTVEGHAPAVPLIRTALTALLADDPFVESGMPLAVLATLASDDLWDDGVRRQVIDKLLAFDRGHGALPALRVTLQCQASSELWAGRFAEAEACYIESSEIARAIGFPDETSHRLELFAWQGREAQTRAAAADVMSVWVEQMGNGSFANHVFVQLALLENSLGRYAEALGWATRVYHEDPPGTGNHALCEMVEAGVRAGDGDAAAAALARLVQRATVSGTSWALGLLARCQALMADDDRAEDLYRESVALLAKTEVRTDLARTHLLYGEWLRRRKRRADARVQLRIAAEMFVTMGATLFAARARTELLATGERARKRDLPANHDLTPQETHVASLAATGATNAEIATRLFVTTSTVEYHLNKIFRKLGITSRRQLTQFLREQARQGVQPRPTAGQLAGA